MTDASSVTSSQGRDSVQSFIPAVVHPLSIAFSQEAPKPHEQHITLYNPFDFAIHFKVMATQPSRYNVSVSQGRLRARASMNVVITFVGSFPRDVESDKFQVSVSDSKNALVGKQIVSSHIYPVGTSVPPTPAGSNTTGQARGHKAGDNKATRSAGKLPSGPRPPRPGPLTVILPSILGLIALLVMSPQPPSPEEAVSHYKTLLVAFFIGGVTCMFQLRALDRYRDLS